MEGNRDLRDNQMIGCQEKSAEKSETIWKDGCDGVEIPMNMNLLFNFPGVFLDSGRS